MPPVSAWSVKLFVLLVLAAPFAVAQAPRAGGATIEGRIINPAPDTKIRLQIVRSTPLGHSSTATSGLSQRTAASVSTILRRETIDW